MEYSGTVDTVMFATRPFNIPTNASVDSSFIFQPTIFKPQVVSQAALDVAYVFVPPASGLYLLSSSGASVLLAMQESL